MNNFTVGKTYHVVGTNYHVMVISNVVNEFNSISCIIIDGMYKGEISNFHINNLVTTIDDIAIPVNQFQIGDFIMHRDDRYILLISNITDDEITGIIVRSYNSSVIGTCVISEFCNFELY